jgi:hypothetical protein
LNLQRTAGSSFKLFQKQKIASFGLLKEPTSSGHFKNLKKSTFHAKEPTPSAGGMAG